MLLTSTGVISRSQQEESVLLLRKIEELNKNTARLIVEAGKLIQESKQLSAQVKSLETQHDAKSGSRRTVRQLPQGKLLDKGRFKNRLAPFSHSSPAVVRLTRMDAVSCRSQSRRTRTPAPSGAVS